MAWKITNTAEHFYPGRSPFYEAQFCNEETGAWLYFSGGSKKEIMEQFRATTNTTSIFDKQMTAEWKETYQT